MPANEFLEMEKEIDDAVENAANKMQDSLSEQLKRICNSGTNENPEVLEKIEEQISNLKDLYSEKTIKEFEKQNGVIPKKTREFLEKVFKEFGEISDQFTQSKNSEYIHDKLEKLISYMNDLSYERNFKENDVTDESLIKDAKAIFFRYKTMLVEGEARKCTELSKR